MEPTMARPPKKQIRRRVQADSWQHACNLIIQHYNLYQKNYINTVYYIVRSSQTRTDGLLHGTQQLIESFEKWRKNDDTLKNTSLQKAFLIRFQKQREHRNKAIRTSGSKAKKYSFVRCFNLICEEFLLFFETLPKNKQQEIKKMAEIVKLELAKK